MQVLLVFNKEDPHIITLKNAIIKCGYKIKCCKNIEEIHEAFKKSNYDLVFIDCRRSINNSNNQHQHHHMHHLHQSKSPPTTTSTATITSAQNISTITQSCNNTNQYDYENICRFIRKLFQYTIIVALTPN
jgi:hypothetical protein